MHITVGGDIHIFHISLRLAVTVREIEGVNTVEWIKQ